MTNLTNLIKKLFYFSNFDTACNLYYVLRQKSKRYPGDWQPVSLYNEDNNFLGQAVFETEREAISYMKKYSERIANKNNLNMLNNFDTKINIQLKIFVENEKPADMNPIPFYKKHTHSI